MRRFIVNKMAKAPPVSNCAFKHPTMIGGLFTTSHIVQLSTKRCLWPSLCAKFIKMSRYIIFAEREDNRIRLFFHFFKKRVLRDVSYPFPRTEPENLENFLGAKFRAERVKRHRERLNLRHPTDLQSERRAKKFVRRLGQDLYRLFNSLLEYGIRL